MEATGELWDEPGTYEVVGSSGSLVLVSVRRAARFAAQMREGGRYPVSIHAPVWGATT